MFLTLRHSYNDEEPKAAPAPAVQEEPSEPIAPQAAAPDASDYDVSQNGQNDAPQGHDYNAGEDSQMKYEEEYEEDDDDVDFNLGNDNSHHADTPTYDRSQATPQYGGHKGPNSKEDG